jgi:Cys-tRNA(Pro)/Cys-tRNA(Cys) deacylase
MAQPKTNAMRILEKEKIPYEMFTYPVTEEHQDGVTVAALCGQDVKTVFKTLVCKGASKNHFVFVVPVAEELDLKKAARAASEKSMEMIHVNDINKVTGYIRGGCSPIGMKKLFPTFFHESALEQDLVIVSGGKRGFQIKCEPKLLASACKGQFADIIFD